MLVITPKYTKHSLYLGVQIFKRRPNTGTHGGMWLVRSTTFKTLASAKRYVDFLALDGNL